MTGRRLLRIILGLVAANVVVRSVQSVLPSREQSGSWFRRHLNFWTKSRSGSDGDGDCGRNFLRSLSFRLWHIFSGGLLLRWTRDVTSHVHLRVMEHIKTLAEGDR